MRRAFSSGSKTKEACETARSVSASNGRARGDDLDRARRRFIAVTIRKPHDRSWRGHINPAGSAPADRRQPRGEHLRPGRAFHAIARSALGDVALEGRPDVLGNVKARDDFINCRSSSEFVRRFERFPA
jgi:hypothetical protein